MIILDTNVLSELMRPEPSQRVLDWVADQIRTQIFTTTISQAEILNGLALLPEGRRRTGLTDAADQMFAEDFAGQILSFDGVAAEAFAAIAASRRRMGSPIQPLDGQIAAIAVAQGASIATRDVTDFQRCGVELINPWGQSAVPLDGNV